MFQFLLTSWYYLTGGLHYYFLRNKFSKASVVVEIILRLLSSNILSFIRALKIIKCYLILNNRGNHKYKQSLSLAVFYNLSLEVLKNCLGGETGAPTKIIIKY